MGAVVVLFNGSLGFPLPLAAGFKIPPIAALVQEKVVPGVRLNGV